MEVLQRTANRGSISTGYDIDNSLKLEADNSEYLNRTSGADGSRTTWTTSVWVKRTELGVNQAVFSSVNNAAHTNFYRFLDSDKIRFYFQPDDVAVTYFADTYAVFRDTSAWYHIVWGLDSTNSDGSKRFVVYVNGVYQDSNWQGSASASTNCPQNAGSRFLQSEPIQIGKGTYGADHYFNGYMAELHVLDGTAPDPTDFGEYDDDSGIWKPKEVDVTYGAQGFYLDFADASDLGDDESGNGNDFAENNIAASDQATDTPTNNFCTLGLQVRAGTSSEIGPVTEGGTFMKQDGVNQSVGFFGTMGVTKGKWYWEVYVPSRSSSYGLLDYIGLHSMKTIPIGAAATTGTSQCHYVLHSGDYNATASGSNGAQNTAAGLPSYGTNGSGKTFGVAFNADDGQITYYANNTRIGNANIDIFDLHDDMGAGTFVVPFFEVYDNNLYVNFGGCSFWANPTGNTDANGLGDFAYSPPSGYYSLCTKNLAEYG